MPASEVEVVLLHEGIFEQEIVSNGNLNALQKSDLYFSIREPLQEIRVNNGGYVKEGDTLAVLQNFTLKNKLSQAKLIHEKAKLAFYDVLIGQGYDHKQPEKVPEEVLTPARIKSGLAGAENDLAMAEYQYQQSFLLSPIPGLVANLFDKENNYPTNNKPFCTIIDHRKFEVVFPVMENEVHLIASGSKVMVHPYIDPSVQLTGTVTAINPIIDEHGLVQLTAIINNQNNLLVEGMNVKIFLKIPVKNRLVIPKEAVTLRTEKPVVFTYQNGTAQWNYVTTGLENNSSIVVEEGLSAGDSVIYKGNIHLAHGTEVVLK
ncbi:MAG: efflux RND transporter periplasmic adaptor subunit [Bacteroidota bacterium]